MTTQPPAGEDAPQWQYKEAPPGADAELRVQLHMRGESVAADRLVELCQRVAALREHLIIPATTDRTGCCFVCMEQTELGAPETHTTDCIARPL